MGLRSIGLPELLVIFVFGLGAVLLTVFPACMISKKAGYSPWWGLLLFVPIGNVIWTWYLALSDWPTLRQPSGVSDSL